MRSQRTLIYALGGGYGHLQRALNVAARLDGPCTVLHQVQDVPDIPDAVTLCALPPMATIDTVHAWLAEAFVEHDAFFVDTFPRGIVFELDDRWFGTVPTTLVARAVNRDNYPGYDEAAARFDDVWLPYDDPSDEWDEPPVGRTVGTLVRALPLHGETDVLVIGDPSTVPASWQILLQGATVVNGRFDTIPRARATIALGCGYNLGWELTRSGVSAAFRPLPRRYDDQFRRACRLGVPLAHAADVAAYLSSGGRP